jgi:hypothetical protein
MGRLSFSLSRLPVRSAVKSYFRRIQGVQNVPQILPGNELGFECWLVREVLHVILQAAHELAA